MKIQLRSNVSNHVRTYDDVVAAVEVFVNLDNDWSLIVDDKYYEYSDLFGISEYNTGKRYETSLLAELLS